MSVLIYLNKNALAPIGGPIGVGYNIEKEIKDKNIENIHFLDRKHIAKSSKWYKNLFPYKMMKYIKRNLYYKKLLDNPSEEVEDVNYLNDFEAIHFHDSVDLFKCRKALSKYKGKVILTTHSPVPRHLEIEQEIITTFEKGVFKKTYSRLGEIDEYAFAHADYIIFPCPEAEESYYNNWSKYGDIISCRKETMRYVETGIIPAVAKNSRAEIRKELNVGEDEFLVSYVGRHNQVKGFDKLIELGTSLLRKHKDIHFVICGKEAPIKAPQQERWTEIGWTTNAHSYIAASDMFVLPNKETYFDLVMLEVLSLGKIVVASRTGGNKYFEGKEAKGVFLYDTLEEAEQIIEMIKDLPMEERKKLEQANYNYFLENLTVEKYVEKYLRTLKELGVLD